MRRISLMGLLMGGLLSHSASGVWAATPTQNSVMVRELPPNLQRFLEQMPLTHSCPLELATAVDHLLVHLPEPSGEAPPRLASPVKGLRLVGNQIYNERQLYEQAIAPLGFQSPYTSEEVRAIAARIAQLYQDNGYITPWITIPNVLPDDKNRLTLVIVESGVEEIQLSYSHLDDRLNTTAVCEQLAAVAYPLQIDHLERALQQLERNPLIEAVQAELVPGHGPAGQVLTVELIGASEE
ncbi:MAG: POTRA domain-containing protein [Spirulinaceae cyanobacterium]